MKSEFNCILFSALYHNVPRFVAHILKRGGVSDEEWRWLKCEKETPDCLQGVLARADEYLLYPKNEEIFRQGLFVLVLGLAIMSFVPGGVRFLGLHFCKDIENFVVLEDETEAGLHWAKIRELIGTGARQ